MAYKVIISPRAQNEIEHAVDYYALYSKSVPTRFIESLEDAYQTLKVNPCFKLQYRNVRAFKIRKFPYSLYFTIDEDTNTVLVRSCFHNKRSPSRRPK